MNLGGGVAGRLCIADTLALRNAPGPARTRLACSPAMSVVNLVCSAIAFHLVEAPGDLANSLLWWLAACARQTCA